MFVNTYYYSKHDLCKCHMRMEYEQISHHKRHRSLVDLNVNCTIKTDHGKSVGIAHTDLLSTSYHVIIAIF